MNGAGALRKPVELLTLLDGDPTFCLVSLVTPPELSDAAFRAARLLS